MCRRVDAADIRLAAQLPSVLVNPRPRVGRDILVCVEQPLELLSLSNREDSSTYTNTRGTLDSRVRQGPEPLPVTRFTPGGLPMEAGPGSTAHGGLYGSVRVGAPRQLFRPKRLLWSTYPSAVCRLLWSTHRNQKFFWFFWFLSVSGLSRKIVTPLSPYALRAIVFPSFDRVPTNGPLPDSRS